MDITQEDKRLFLERHFKQEVKMLLQSAVVYFNPKSYRSEVALESFLIHIRNLHEFFYEYGKKKTAYALDYNKKWKIKEKLDELKIWIPQINNYLLHLGYERHLVESKPYKPYLVDKLYIHFRKLILDFWSELYKKYKTPDLIRIIKKLEMAKLV